MDTKRMLKAVLFTPGPKGHWGIPVLMEGPPGSAKSSIIEQVGAECGLHTETVIASVREPADFLGLPIPSDGRVEYMPTSWAYRAAKAKYAVGFLDELNTAPEAVQAALLRVVLDRAVGDLVLPVGVRILAAQNSVEEAAGGHDLSLPLANRFLHWSWSAPDVELWTDWVLSSSNGGAERLLDAAQEEQRVLGVWEPLFAKSKGLITSFLRKRPELLHKQPKGGDPQASKAWPSRRTWEMAMRVYAGAEAHGLQAEEQEMLLTGCVGTGAAAEYIRYITETDLPDPAELLDGKITWKADKRLDRTLAVFSSCAALVASEKCDNRSARAAKLWGMISEHATKEADVVVPGARAMVKAKLSAMKEAKPALIKLQPVFQAAGLMP